MLPRFPAILLAWTLGGCGYVSQPGLDATNGADVYGPPRLEIGGANDDGIGFIPWHGATVRPKIIQGPQGGQHIWVSMRSNGLWPKKIMLSVDMRDATTGALVLPGDVTRILGLTPHETFDAYDGFIAYVSEPCAIADRPIRVTMFASDLYGVATSDSAIVLPIWSTVCAP